LTKTRWNGSPFPKLSKIQPKKDKAGKAIRDETFQNVSTLIDTQKSSTTDTTTVVKPVKTDGSAKISGSDLKAPVTPRPAIDKVYTAEEKRQAALEPVRKEAERGGAEGD
jgi:hypothetical protein